MEYYFCMRIIRKKQVFRSYFISLCVFISVLMGMSSCTEDSVNVDTDFKLVFSADTIRFDTIFTDMGSATLKLKVYNASSQKAYIEHIRLMNATHFHLNVNGVPSDDVNDVYLNAKDSMLVFVQVTIDPSDATNPFVVRDSILFSLNGKNQQVQLEAYGQNAVRLDGITVTTDSVLTAKLPYLVSDTLRILPGVRLTIEPGTRLFFKKHAVLLIEGQLIAEGNAQQVIQFRGDRDDYMNTIPPLSYDLCSGQWGGIVIAEGSFDNRLVHADVRNTDFGIRIDSTSTDRMALYVAHSMLRNSTVNVLEATNAKMSVNNSLLYNAGNYVVALQGGDYVWKHCTFANYYQFAWGGRTNPILLYANKRVDVGSDASIMPFTSKMYNSLVYGSYTNEIQLKCDESPIGSYVFSHCLLRHKVTTITNPPYNQCVFNADPLFVFQQWKEERPHVYDFNIVSGSGAIGIGDNQIANEFPLDLNGNSRLSDGAPDAGCFEYIQ